MMKTLLFTSLLFLTGATFAQSINIPSTLSVSEGNAELDKVQRNGFSVLLAGDEKDIIKAFEDFLEDDKGYKVKSVFKKISAEDILIPAFSEKHFNLNAQVRESGTTFELWYWVSFGQDVYVNTQDYADEAAKCKAILKEFAQKYYTDFINEDLESSNEVLEKSQDNLKDIISDLAGLNKDKLKEEKKQKKLEKKKLKLEEDLADINEDIKENQTESAEKEEEIAKIATDITEKANAKTEVETKISEQQKTIQELQEKLQRVKGY